MIPEESCNTLYITELLRHQHPTIAKKIEDTCSQHSIEVKVIAGANDLWCRDFMPVQVSPHRYIQFRFDPSYYKPHWQHLKTEVNNLDMRLSIICSVLLAT